MSESDVIDINQADEATLANLPGLGQALARRIIEYRETVHPFTDVSELTAVPGISERMVRALANRIRANPAPPTDDESDEADEEPTAVSATEDTVAAAAADTPTSSKAAAAASLAAQDVTDDDEETAAEEEPAAGEDETTAAVETAVADNVGVDDTAADRPDGSPLATGPGLRLEAIPDPNEFAQTPPEDAAEPPPALVTRSDAISQRRGCIFVILSAVLGALLGSALTLAILAAVNGGTLTFAQANTETRSDLRQVRSEQEDLATGVVTLEAQQAAVAQSVTDMQPRLNGMATQQPLLMQTVTATNEDLATAVADLTELEESAAALEERITTLVTAAENFDLFLSGMQELLWEIQGPVDAGAVPTATPVVTPTLTVTATVPPVTATPSSATLTPTETAVAPTTPTATLLPTRTPRPTSTPIVLPSPTPTRQPEP